MVFFNIDDDAAEVYRRDPEAFTQHINKFVCSVAHKFGLPQNARLHITQLGQGSFNAAYNIHVYERNGEDHDIVFRVPHTRHCLCKEALTLREVDHQIKANELQTLKAPRVFDWSCGSDNGFGWPYMIVERVRGTALIDVWGSYNDEQRIGIAAQLGQAHYEMLTIKSHATGKFDANNDCQNPSFRLTPHGSSAEYLKNHILQYGCSPRMSSRIQQCEKNDHLPRSVADTMLDSFEWSICYEECTGRTVLHGKNTWLKFQRMVKEMEFIGLFSGDGYENGAFNVWHRDLFPRNIMVDTDEAGVPVLTGFIDWDDSIYGPDFAACPAPKWMWRDCYMAISGDCSCCGRIEEESLDEMKQDAHNSRGKAIKDAFDSNAGPSWQRLAYLPEYAIARKLFGIASRRWISDCRTRESEKAVGESLIAKWHELINSDAFKKRWHLNVYNGQIRKAPVSLILREQLSEVENAQYLAVLYERELSHKRNGGGGNTSPARLLPPPGFNTIHPGQNTGTASGWTGGNSNSQHPDQQLILPSISQILQLPQNTQNGPLPVAPAYDPFGFGQPPAYNYELRRPAGRPQLPERVREGNNHDGFTQSHQCQCRECGDCQAYNTYQQNRQNRHGLAGRHQPPWVRIDNRPFNLN
ncbi:hypothetical protein JX266_001891 [Neoarthrinium moseri]|nr:hypothetical protein JX266_001891 [Neoarthrinium moseri]